VSYSRFGEGSDIYLYCYDDTLGQRRFECVGCCLSKYSGHSALLRGFDEAILHVREHIAAGDKVENDVIPLLEQTRKEDENNQL